MHDRHDVLKSNKYPILITIGFFLVTSLVSFLYHDFWTISVTSLNNAKNILATAYPALTDIADEL